MSEAQPETVVGRRLLDYLNAGRPLSRDETQLGYGFGTGTARSDPMLDAILAIEAEARAAGAARYEAALREWVAAETPGIVHAKPFAEYGYDVAKAEITSILRELAAASLPVPEPLPQGDGLDVERLAAVLHKIDGGSDGADYTYTFTGTIEELAETIRDEYAARNRKLAAEVFATPSRPAEERKS